MAGGVGILNNHAWSRQPKGIGSRKTQWPALSIEGIIELPFEFLVCARMVMGERLHYPVHNTHRDSVLSPYSLRAEVFVASFTPDDDLIISRGTDAGYAKTIPAMLCLPIATVDGKEKEIKREQAFPSSIVGMWYGFLAVKVLSFPGSVPEKVGSDMSRLRRLSDSKVPELSTPDL